MSDKTPPPQLLTAAEETPDIWSDGKAFSPMKGSAAVIASDGTLHGVLLHWIGWSMEYQVDACGHDLTCLGLDGFDAGIWIWEGDFRTVVYDSPDYGRDYDVEAVGEVRKPTDEEWDLIQNEEAPWDDNDYLAKKGEICWDCNHYAHAPDECDKKILVSEWRDIRRACECKSAADAASGSYRVTMGGLYRLV